MTETKQKKQELPKSIGGVTSVEVVNARPVMEPTPTERAEIDSQIATAKRYPRSVSAFQRECLTLATMDKDTAESCFYVLPRAGTTIEGPSIRLAEIALSAWGNALAQAEVIHEDGRYIYAVGTCRDLEKNVAFRITTRRRITDRNGKRFNDDMIAVTANAACSIALRNAIFKIVPGAFIKDVFTKVKQVAVGDASTLAARRIKAFQYLQKMGATKERILAALEKRSIEDVDVDDLVKLIGFANSIRDGDATVDTVFPPVEKKPKDESSKKVGDVLPDFDDGGVTTKVDAKQRKRSNRTGKKM